MTRRKNFEKNIRKLAKVGGGSSYSVTIPIDMIRKLGWKETQKVVFELDEKNKEVKIKDWER